MKEEAIIPILNSKNAIQLPSTLHPATVHSQTNGTTTPPSTDNTTLHTFKARTKLRWTRASILDILTKEFPLASRAEHQEAIAAGRVQVNGFDVVDEYILRMGDMLEYTVHLPIDRVAQRALSRLYAISLTNNPTKHTSTLQKGEINGDLLEIIHESCTLVVVNKPCGIAVHPCGMHVSPTVLGLLNSRAPNPQYSMQSIANNPSKTLEPKRKNKMQKVDVENEGLFVVHRLDVLTSGVVIFARDKLTCSEMQKSLRTAEKVYLALVRGVFPSSIGDSGESVYESLAGNRNVDEMAGGFIECSAPIQQSTVRIVNYIARNQPNHTDNPIGKPCHTKFKRIWTRTMCADELVSLVECRPTTGRTHQIRVHLQFLGHAIVNDPIYACEAWGQGRGKGGVSEQDIASIGKRIVDDLFSSKARQVKLQDGGLVGECRDLKSGVDEGIYLHCLRYANRADQWGFSSPVPEWAL